MEIIIQEFDSPQDALKNWHYEGFDLVGIREQGGYVELEANHAEHKNLLARGRNLQRALEGLERQIDILYKDE